MATMSTVYPIQSDKISGYTPGGYPIGDRAISSSDLADIDREIYSDGIISTATGSGAYYQVVTGGGMNLVVYPGKCYIRGRKASTPTNTVISVENADALMNRTDRVVLRLDLSNDVRDVIIDVKKGITSLTRTSSVWELGLADVLVKKGAVSISQSDITDLRFNTEICGKAYNELLKVDTTSIFNQIQAIMLQQENKWKEQTDKQNSDFDEFRSLMAALGTQSFAIINNNFDDLSVKLGCERITVFESNGDITETITILAIGKTLATRKTSFPNSTTIIEEVAFYPHTFETGNNIVETVTFTMTKTTVFNANGSIKETVTGTYSGGSGSVATVPKVIDGGEF